MAVQDICNTSGVLLARQGARVDYATARCLTQHKSAQPIEQQLQIEGSLTTEGLHQQLLAFLNQHEDLAILQKNLHADGELDLLYLLLNALRLTPHPSLVRLHLHQQRPGDNDEGAHPEDRLALAAVIFAGRFIAAQ